MDGEMNGSVRYDVQPGYTWYRIEIPVMQKCKFTRFINAVEKCFFWMETIDDATLKYYGLGFAPNGLNDILSRLDFLDVGEWFSIVEVNNHVDFLVNFRCLLMESLYYDAGLLSWKKISNQFSSLTVDAFIITEEELGNYDDEN
jgi:hypothetical protein